MTHASFLSIGEAGAALQSVSIHSQTNCGRMHDSISRIVEISAKKIDPDGNFPFAGGRTDQKRRRLPACSATSLAMKCERANRLILKVR